MNTTRKVNFQAGLRTLLLLSTLTGILVAIGALIGGAQTALLFLGIALVFNFFSYWFSDKIAIKMSGAKPISREEDPELYQMMDNLVTRAKLPMPKMYVIPQEQPNAFATGRNPDHSAVAVTRGLQKLMSREEIEGVLAHELAHIKNRDILTQSVAAAVGGAITWIAYSLMWFGSDDESPLGLFGALALVILAPLAATLVQLAVSRQREYSADATGASITGNPEGLASALLRLDSASSAMPMHVNQSAEPLYIVRPFKGRGLQNMFSTHPQIEDRVKRLREMRPSL